MNTTPAELRSLLDSIVKGATRKVADLSMSEFVDLYDSLLKRVDQDRTDVTLVLADGQAWVSFPKLSRQILKVTGPRPLSREDLRLTSPGKVTVVGGDHRSFLSFLTEDLRDARLVAAGLLAGVLAASAVVDIGDLVPAIAPLLALASSIFFAVFVLFGVGEVIRDRSLQVAMFRSGQLQRFLDADRYLVRLAVVSFLLSIVTVIAGPVRLGFLKHLGADALVWAEPVSYAILALLLWVSVISTLLCLRSASGYLLDRAAGALLLDLGEDAIKSANDPLVHTDNPGERPEAPISSDKR